MAAIADSSITGLRISNEHVISQLSGPVSIVILQPNAKSTYFQAYKKAPLFILFGDIHCSDANLCKPSPGAIRIYDINFLNMMCSILKDNEVIDVCTEGENLTNQTNITTLTREPIYAFHNLVRICNNFKKEDSENYKMVQKIRWHHTDIRFWTLYIPEVQKVREDRPRKYYNMFEFLSIRVDGNKLYKDNYKPDIFYKVFQSYRSKLIDEGYSFEANIAVNVIEIYSKLVENRYSLINYQISKITEESDRKFLKQKIKLYIEYMYDKECNLSTLIPKDLGILIRQMHNKMIGFCNGDLVGLEEIHGTREYTIYKNFILRIETIKLDIFTFAKSFTRMLETTAETPIINMCYFGNLHIQNMTHFITKILNSGGVGGDAYNVILTHGIGQDAPNPLSKDANRCLDFSQIKKSSISELLNPLRQMSKSK